jgi:TP901 family phage tail tape measure protein
MARKILFEIEIENVGAARRIEELREEIRRLNKELKGADAGSDAFKELIAKITDAKLETAELKEQQKQLNREFQAAKFPKDSLQGLRIEYGKLTDQIKILSAAERGSKFGESLIKNAANVKGQIDGIEQSLGRFTGNVGNYRSAFASLAEIATGGLIGGGVVVTINALTNAFTKGLTSLFDYTAGLSRLSAITGVTGAALDDLGQRARGLTTIELSDGSEIVNTAQDIFEAFTLVGSARPELLEDAAALEEVSKQAIVLSKASGDDLETSVRAVTTTLGQFKEESSAAGRIINELAAGSKLGASEIRDTTVALQKFGTTASVSNVSTAESIALIETLADRQLKGEEAGVQLRNILAKLAGADILPKKALAELEQAGVSLDVLKDTTLPLITRLQELGKLQGNTAALTKVFGLENLSAAQIITQGIPKYEELLAGIQGTNEAYVQAGIQADNAAQRFENLQNKGLNLLTQAFLGIEPVITSVVDLLGGLVDVLSAAPEFLSENAEEVVALSFVLLSFTKASQTAAASTLALTTLQGRYTAAMAIGNAVTATGTIVTNALSAAQRAMPLIALVAGIYAIVKAFEVYEASASSSERATKAVAAAQEEIAESSAKEVAAIEKNILVLKTDNLNKENRKKAIEELNKINPEYLKGIDLEKASLSELDVIQQKLTETIIRAAAERRKQIEQEKLVQQRITAQLEINRLETGGATFFEQGTEQQRIKLLNQAIEGIDEEMDAIDEKFSDVFGLDRPEITRGQKRLLDFTTDLSAQFNGVFDAANDASKATDNLAKKPIATQDATGETIQALKTRLQGLKTELDNTEIGSGRFKALQKEIATLEAQLARFDTKKSRDEITAQAGSVAALKEEISKLQKQIESASPGSPALDGLIKKLDATKAKLKETEQALLASTFKSLFGRDLVAPEIDVSQQPELTIQPELVFEPDAKEKLIQEASAVADAVEASLKAVEFKVEVPENDAERKFREEREKGNEAIRKQQEEDAAAELKRREELQQQAIDSAITAAQTISDSLTQIQNNRLQRETDAALAQLDTETQGKIAAAQGNEAKIKQIEKEAAVKRAAIEKEAARERKKIAVREAIINTALAITKALTGAPPPANLILAGVAAAAGAAQLAVINSQEFAEGGVVKEERNRRTRKGDVLIAVSEFADGGTVTDKTVRFSRNDVTERIEEFAAGGSIKRLKSGIIREPQNAPRTPHGDTVLAYLAPGEMVLNKGQQNTLRSLYGQDAFALAGVPGESATRRTSIPGFASGGVVGIVPQNGFAQQVSGQPVSVEAKAEFSGQQIDELGQSMGTIIAAEVSKQLRVGLAEGLFDANRRLEREAISDQNRRG